MIYLDNSATTYPKPEMVKAAVMRGVSYLGANPGRGSYPMAEAASAAVYEVRKKVASFFGASGAENVIFTKSCTEALNQVLFGLLKSGDHVVISDIEHNAVLRPVKALEQKGVENTIFETFLGNSDQTTDSLRKALRGNTKLVVCTAASNVFGMRLPIRRLAALCRINGISFCVDAAQAAGILPFHMQEDEIDYLCIPSHKGLYGIMGAGILVTDKGSSLTPLVYGGTGVNSQSPHQPEETPERLESGTLNVPGIMGMGAGLDFIARYGVENIHRGELEKVSYLYERLQSCNGVILYTPYPQKEDFVPVLSFNVKNKGSEEVGSYLAGKGIAVRCGLHCAPLAHRKFGTEDGTVRLSPSVFTTKENLAYFLRQIILYR
ncbi:MAG: aminotransferase class V-fold PLP-dependent enzyme [Oscillospiraceae bacterium]